MTMVATITIGNLSTQASDTWDALIVFYCLGLAWGVLVIVPALRYRRYAIQKYGRPLLHFKESIWQRYKRRSFVVVFVCCLLLYGYAMGKYPDSESIPSSVALGYVGLSILALIIRILPPWRKKTALYHAQQMLLAKEQAQAAVHMAGLINNVISEELHDRLDELQQVKSKIARQQQIANLISSEYTPALASILQTAQHKDEKKHLRQEILFLIISFVLGFIANWSSESVLHTLQSLLHIG
jgi:23S rRNA maturation mini-RNase III